MYFHGLSSTSLLVRGGSGSAEINMPGDSFGKAAVSGVGDLVGRVELGEIFVDIVAQELWYYVSDWVVAGLILVLRGSGGQAPSDLGREPSPFCRTRTCPASAAPPQLESTDAAKTGVEVQGALRV